MKTGVYVVFDDRLFRHPALPEVVKASLMFPEDASTLCVLARFPGGGHSLIVWNEEDPQHIDDEEHGFVQLPSPQNGRVVLRRVTTDLLNDHAPEMFPDRTAPVGTTEDIEASHFMQMVFSGIFGM